MTVRIEFSGLNKVGRRLAQASERVTNAAERALLRGGLLVERDAKTSCPVDTGRLRASITHVLEGAGSRNPTVYVGTSVQYSRYVEFGTSKMSAKPFLFPALNQNKEEVKRMVAEAIRGEMK